MKNAISRMVAPTVFCGLACLPALSLDPPDSAVNPQNGHIIVVDTPPGVGDFNVRCTINTGVEEREVFDVSTNILDDLGPRVAISSIGDAWVVWWRDDATDLVVVRKRSYANGTWSNERLVSKPDESSRKPKMVHDGTTAWVAFEFDDQGGTSIGLTSIIDDPDPIPQRTVVATTNYDQELDVRLNSEASSLWVTWVDSVTELGWSEYDYSVEQWSTPAYEPYMTGDTAGARATIRATVVGETLP